MAITVAHRTIPSHWPRIGAMDFGWMHAFAAAELAWLRTGASKALHPGDDAREIAVRLPRDETGKQRWSDFNRPLHYPKNFY